MKDYIITYENGGAKLVKGYDILQALTSVDRLDMVIEIREVKIRN